MPSNIRKHKFIGLFAIVPPTEKLIGPYGQSYIRLGNQKGDLIPLTNQILERQRVEDLRKLVHKTVDQIFDQYEGKI